MKLVAVINGTNTGASVPSVGSVAEVVLIPAAHTDPSAVVALAAVKLQLPLTSQSPAVRLTLVTFAGVAVVRDTAEPTAMAELMTSPTFPAAAAEPPVYPTHPVSSPPVVVQRGVDGATPSAAS